jgi:hypothetical protein
VKDTVVEDLMLAVRYLEAGRTHLFALADRDMATRMYTALPGIIEGWSKNFFMGALQTTRSRPLAYAGLLWSLIVPAIFLLPLAELAVGLALRAPARIAFGLAGYVGAALLIGQILRAARVSTWYGLCHPLGALLQAYIIVRAMVRGTRRIEWKGRTYSHR